MGTGGETAPLVGPDSVVVDTFDATGIDTESATLNGELVDLDGTESVDVDFEWREAGTDTWNTTSVQTIDASTAFEAQLTGLESGTDYEYRSVAESTTTTTRGSTVPFGTTRSGAAADTCDGSFDVLSDSRCSVRSS